MRCIRRAWTIALSANVPDQLVADGISEVQRRAAFDGSFSVACTQSATGLLVGVMRDTENVSPTINQPVILATAPIYPDHVLVEDVILAGQLIGLPVINTTGGALTLFGSIQLP